MSGKEAARVGDQHDCPQHKGGGPIDPPGAQTVNIGGQPAARMNDMASCQGRPQDKIITGSFTVCIEGQPAARVSDKTAHGGVIISGCGTVLIGLSGTAGNVLGGTSMCAAAASGRKSGSTQQSYSNCGVESCRQIINKANGTNISEDAFLQNAINNNLAQGVPGQAPTSWDGGVSLSDIQQILGNNGVPASQQNATPENTGIALSRGQGVIAALDAYYIWQPRSAVKQSLPHAVLVTGIEYDDKGNRTAIIINDTGTGNCGQRIAVSDYDQAIAAISGSLITTTNNPIW